MRYLLITFVLLVGCAQPVTADPDCSGMEKDIAAVIEDMQIVTSFRPELSEELERLRNELDECLN